MSRAEKVARRNCREQNIATFATFSSRDIFLSSDSRLLMFATFKLLLIFFSRISFLFQVSTVNAHYLDYLLSRPFTISTFFCRSLGPPVGKNTLVNSTFRYLDLFYRSRGNLIFECSYILFQWSLATCFIHALRFLFYPLLIFD